MVKLPVFGTTISPYMFFWQAAQEVEDRRAGGALGADGVLQPDDVATVRRHLRRIRWDTYLGMGFSNVIAFCIMLSTAVTLHAAGITNIHTASQAAEALRPLGGQLTFLLFSLGIIGTGMLAVPVLASSAAYAVAESFEWRSGLDMRLREARDFYALIAVPIMAVMMLLAARADIMGSFVVRPRLRRLGWTATGVMAATVVAMVATL